MAIAVHLPGPLAPRLPAKPVVAHAKHATQITPEYEGDFSWDCLPDYIESDSISPAMLEHCNAVLLDIHWAAMEEKLDRMVGCRYLLHRQMIPYKNFTITRDYITLYRSGRQHPQSQWEHVIVTYNYAMEYSPYHCHVDIYNSYRVQRKDYGQV